MKGWKDKSDNFESEKNFYYKKLKDSKKKNKLLKMTIERMNTELEKREKLNGLDEGHEEKK